MTATRGTRLRRPADPDRRKRFGLLLLAITAAFAIQGIAPPGPWEQLLVALLLATTLLLALRVADVKGSVMTGAAICAVALVVVSLVAALAGVTDSASARIANLLFVVLAPPAIIIGIVRTLQVRSRVTIEAVFGVLCLYLLLGQFFAFVYGLIGNFAGPFFAGGAASSTAHVIYFSFTTLTTVGYGDFTAASNLGHTLAVTEALLGQIYLVTVVAVIVGNLGQTRFVRERPEKE